MSERVAITRMPFSPLSLALALVATLGVAYVALISVVMSYAALTVSFSQSVRNDEASVAALESQYLDTLATITHTDYAAAGYQKPVAEIYVPGIAGGTTALR